MPDIDKEFVDSLLDEVSFHDETRKLIQSSVSTDISAHPSKGADLIAFGFDPAPKHDGSALVQVERLNLRPGTVMSHWRDYYVRYKVRDITLLDTTTPLESYAIMLGSHLATMSFLWDSKTPGWSVRKGSGFPIRIVVDDTGQHRKLSYAIQEGVDAVKDSLVRSMKRNGLPGALEETAVAVDIVSATYVSGHSSSRPIHYDMWPKETKVTDEALMSHLGGMIRNRQIVIPSDMHLLDDLMIEMDRLRISRTPIRRKIKIEGSSDDLVDALLLALWAATPTYEEMRVEKSPRD